MWGTVFPNTCCNWEPIELQILKKQLASLDCNCSACGSTKDPVSSGEDSDHNDAAIQVETQNDPLNRLIYGNCDSTTAYTECEDRCNNMMEYYRNDLFCPNCYFIWDLLRRLTKVFKDEECETGPNMFSSDKSTEKGVELVDSSTSVTHKPIGRLPSNLTLCDFISETTINTPSTPHAKLRNNNDRVTFKDDNGNNICSRIKNRKPAIMHGHCFCLDNFIEAIRPPLPM